MSSRRAPPSTATRNYEKEVVQDLNTADVTLKYYSRWAEKYNHDTTESNYNGPQYICEAFFKLSDVVNKDAKILDVVAGTGMVGERLKKAGYTNVDGHDGCQEMLDAAKEKDLYKEYICCILGGDHKAPIADGAYDALIMSGGFTPGHLYADVFPELLRLTKKDGYICWAMRAQHEEYSTKFLDFDSEVDKLVNAGKWKYYIPRERFPDYVLGYDGFIYIMKKIKN